MKKLLPRWFVWIALAELAFSSRVSAQNPPRLWDVRGASLFVDCCPAIDSNGVVYVTISGSTKYSDVSGGKLVAIDSRGVQKWAFPTPVDIKSSPAIGADGNIYFGCRDRRLYAVSPAGRLLWSYLTGAWIDSSPAIGTNGVIYAGSWDGKFYALNPDGTRKWEFPTGGPVDSSPAIGTNGVIYFGSHDNNFYALNPDGRARWTFPTQGPIISSPAIGDDETIIFTSVDGRLYALDPDGREKWHVWTGGVSGSSPVLDAAGNIFLGVNNMFVALDPAGVKKWDFGYPMIEGAPVVAADGTVYCGGNNEGVGNLYRWNATGAVQLAVPLDGGVFGSPAIGSDGTVYIGALTTICEAFKGGVGMARGGWPKFRGNAAQNGRAGAN
ncbi:MAG TPA: PQQ-binding-like beta-propeller repeat protein [Verrucomicrobiae bacterium]|jgi:outer membrane protein assembly factor BamB|nr:PQQ-binding-like beta-propeller repeat protein [Verrucomicrobiae bacterium]